MTDHLLLQPLGRAARAAARFPMKTMLAAIVLSFVIVRYPPLEVGFAHDEKTVKQAEFYPFSSFPMYSSFSARTFFVYLTDGAGEPLPLTLAFGTRSSVLRKFYNNQLRETKAAIDVDLRDMTAAQKSAAGTATLHHLIDHLAVPRPDPSAFPELQLVEVVLERDGRRVVRSESVVGRVRLGGTADPSSTAAP